MATSKKVPLSRPARKTSSAARAISQDQAFADISETLERLEMLARLSPVGGTRAANTGDHRFLEETRLRLLRRLADANAAVARARNVDINAPDEDRARSYEQLARACVNALGGGEDAIRFVVRTGWHEGAKLKKRVQSAGGPARSFLQTEAQAARDAVLRAKAKSWLDELATVAGRTESELEAAAKLLPTSGGSPHFPAGNLIGSLLESDDLFGVYLGRIYVTTTSDPFGSTRSEQADFWEKHWHKVPNPAAKQQFITGARQVDAWFGWN